MVCILVGLWVLSWIGARLLIVKAPPTNADALLLLSGSSTILERTHYAAALYFQHRTPKILLTNDNQMGGWSAEDNRNPYYVEIASRELQRLGVPGRDIEVIGNTVSSTYDEANVLRDYTHGKNIHSILLVTSGYHSRRALRTFRHALAGSGIEVGLEPVPTGWQTPNPAVWWVTPRGWKLVAGEYLKLIIYGFREQRSGRSNPTGTQLVVILRHSLFYAFRRI